MSGIGIKGGFNQIIRRECDRPMAEKERLHTMQSKLQGLPSLHRGKRGGRTRPCINQKRNNKTYIYIGKKKLRSV